MSIFGIGVYYFNLDYQVALIVGAVIVISYTFLGGYLAVCWTDFFQGILMFCAIIIVPVAGVIQLGGLQGATQAIQSVDPNLLNLYLNANGETITVIAIVSNLAWGLFFY